MKDYFWTYGENCYYRPEKPIKSDEALSNQLGHLSYINKKCKFDEQFYRAVKHALYIPYGFEIKFSGEGEMIFHQSEDLWVGIPLKHFRVRLRFPVHRFFHTLFTDMRWGLGHIGPNSIRKICAFIVWCTELNM